MASTRKNASGQSTPRYANLSGHYELSSEEEARSIATSENIADKPRNGENARPLPARALKALAVEAGGRGNCFFYSLHAALDNKGLLNNVCAVLGLSIEKEAFNTGFRNLLSLSPELRDQYSTVISNLCEQIVNGFSINASLRDIPDQHAKILRKLDLTNCFPIQQTLLDELLDATSTSGVYVGEVEVKIVAEILRTICNVYLDIKSRLLARVVPYDNRVVLYNINSGHYQWLKLIEKNASRGSKKKSKKNRK